MGLTSSRNDSLSWVSHNTNLTFDNMINDILDNNLDLIVLEYPKLETTKIYLPFVGYCLQYKHSLKNGNKVPIATSKLDKNLVVYVTDPHYTTNYGLMFQSQTGDKIK